MKKKIVFLLLSALFLFSNSSFGQEFDLNLSATMLKNNGPWKKKTEINITKFVHTTALDQYGQIKDVFYLEDNQGNKVDITSKVNDCFDFKYENTQQLWDANIITNVLYMLKKKGFQYNMRSEMEEEALDYIQKVKSLNLELNDPYLEAHIYIV